MNKLLLYIVWFFATIKYSFATSSNPFVQQLDTTTAWGISTSWEIMQTPLWGLIYFIIGMLIIATIIGIIVAVISWGRSHSK